MGRFGDYQNTPEMRLKKARMNLDTVRRRIESEPENRDLPHLIPDLQEKIAAAEAEVAEAAADAARKAAEARIESAKPKKEAPKKIENTKGTVARILRGLGIGSGGSARSSSAA